MLMDHPHRFLSGPNTVTCACSLMGKITRPNVTPPIARLLLLLLPLLQPSGSVNSGGNGVSATHVGASTVHHICRIQDCTRQATDTEHGNHTLCCDRCSQTDGRFHTAACDAADYDLNAPSSSTVPAPVNATDSKDTPTDFCSYAALIPPSPLCGGNLGSIFTSNNPQTSGKDKHMQVRFFKHRDNAKSGQLIIKFIGTKENVSDFFTKALLRAGFCKFRALCMNEVEMAEVEI